MRDSAQDAVSHMLEFQHFRQRAIRSEARRRFLNAAIYRGGKPLPDWDRSASCTGLGLAYGTDLLGEMHRRQSGEFALRARVLPAIEVLRSATTLAAKLCGMEVRAGIIKPGPYANLLGWTPIC